MRLKISLFLLVITALCGLGFLLAGSLFTYTPTEAGIPENAQMDATPPAAKVVLARLYEAADTGRTQYGMHQIGKYREDTPMPALVHQYDPYETTLLVLINIERENAGLEPFVLSRKLSMSASKHSADMAANNYFSHTNLAGVSFSERIMQTGFTFSAAGENLYAGNGPYNSPENAVTSWMNSPSHRANILNPNFTHIGLGYRFNAESTYGGYYTADFGKP